MGNQVMDCVMICRNPILQNAMSKQWRRA